MTTKELIRAEIERRIHSIEKCPFIIAELGAKEREIGEVMAYKDILALIDSLPDEPVSNDLTKAAEWQRKQDELLSKITEEHLEGLRWIIRTGITTQPRPYHKYCKDLLQLLESYKNEI